jgi:hypothetical protein
MMSWFWIGISWLGSAALLRSLAQVAIIGGVLALHPRAVSRVEAQITAAPAPPDLLVQELRHAASGLTLRILAVLWRRHRCIQSSQQQPFGLDPEAQHAFARVERPSMRLVTRGETLAAQWEWSTYRRVELPAEQFAGRQAEFPLPQGTNPGEAHSVIMDGDKTIGPLALRSIGEAFRRICGIPRKLPFRLYELVAQLRRATTRDS